MKIKIIDAIREIETDLIVWETDSIVWESHEELPKNCMIQLETENAISEKTKITKYRRNIRRIFLNGIVYNYFVIDEILDRFFDDLEDSIFK